MEVRRFVPGAVKREPFGSWPLLKGHDGSYLRKGRCWVVDRRLGRQGWLS
jgi:hypothetical protein